MSADNGYILHKNDAGKFVLQMFFASSEEMPDPNKAGFANTFDTLEEAMRAYQKIQDSEQIIEYGLTVHI